MPYSSDTRWRLAPCWCLGATSTWRSISFAVLLGFSARATFAAPSTASSQAGLVLTAEGTVEVSRVGIGKWETATTNLSLAFGDNLRTGARSRATVRMSDLSILRVNERTLLEIRPQDSGSGSLLNLHKGEGYFLNRSAPASIQFRTPLVSGAIRGTEFDLNANEEGTTTVSLVEGEVALANATGELVLKSGEQGVVEDGKPMRKTALLNAVNAIQWSLYYPAVIDPDDLRLTDSEKAGIAGSLAAYREGDLLAALDKYPENAPPATDAGRLYRAGLLLAVGQARESQALITKLDTPSSFGDDLRRLIAAVKHTEFTALEKPSTASDWLAESYYLQSRNKLDDALRAARAATEKSPRFGFAWMRVAELEFGNGRIGAAKTALDKGLSLSPRNAQALALRGFLLAAANHNEEALESFDEAIAVDGALGNAWLGRGLCKIRSGEGEEGRKDLQVAAALEPNRADLRSYLGKAWDKTHDRKHAEKELRMARELDPNDPTSWLYSALLNHEYNEDNTAIRDLEKSQSLNTNRGVYRSRLLLDQDQAVRGANLAKIYQDTGLTDVGVREASRSVDLDYANYSAHLFLANSYDALRDPRQVNLRYETPWLSQQLVADLLAPVGAVSLSQNVSQQEYSRLFEGDHFGLYNSTEYLSRGAWVENASQYGNYGNTGFAFDEYYRNDKGERPNNDVDSLNFNARFKQQLDPNDSLFFQLNYSDYSSGDELQYYNQNAASKTLRITETQVPNLFAGYHREWSPGIHTLFLVGRLQDTFTLSDPNSIAIVTTKNGAGTISGVAQRPAALSYSSELEAYSAELQQIFQAARHTLVLGVRGQYGDIEASSFVRRLVPRSQSISPALGRVTAYGYYTYEVAEPLQLTAGLAYDHLDYPQNNELPPVNGVQSSIDKVSPKAGFRWMPARNSTFRGLWSRSLGGVFYDTSVRLEPTELDGFNQAFRSILPESVAGLVPGSEFETFGLAFDQKLTTQTYFNITGEILNSLGTRTVGTLDAFGPVVLDIPSGVNQTLDFEEKSATMNLNQLLGKEFTVGASYKISQGTLRDSVPAISPALSAAFGPSANRTVSAVLNQANLYAVFNHRCGFFSKAEAVWSSQSNFGYTADLPGDDFWQFNLFAGYRLPHRLAEIQVGLLNVGDQDYQLNPLNLHAELPRARTFVARFKFNF